MTKSNRGLFSFRICQKRNENYSCFTESQTRNFYSTNFDKIYTVYIYIYLYVCEKDYKLNQFFSV